VKKRLYQNLLLAVFSILVGFSVVEAVIRYAGAYDQDGNFIIYGRVLKPYHLPVRTMQQKVDIYAASNHTRLMYDPNLGWTPRPNTRDGLYSYNSQGIRTNPAAPVEYSPSPPPDTLRIVIIGDSYTHGDEVSSDHTWGYFLEKKLQAAGLKAEVINLAVGSYGLDQAFLRWDMLGRALSPDIVILGLQLENVQRNVNLLKPLYQLNTGLPFSKPRYILTNGELVLINVPTLPPEQIPAVLAQPTAWPLIDRDYFYKPEDYQERLWLNSRLVGLALEVTSPVETQPIFYDLKQEPATLTIKIIATFKNRIKDSGSDFLMVHIPIILDLMRLSCDQELIYADLLAEIEMDNGVVRPQEALLAEARASSLFSLFMPGGHYSARSNEIIADAIAKRILMMKNKPGD
jgi:hypothetical protein